jgi:hypothetical protein
LKLSQAVTATNESSSSSLEDSSDLKKPISNSDTAIPSLAILDLPSNMTDTFRSHQPVFVGDIILAEFRRLLQREGIAAEFVNGVLVCNDTVAIKKVKIFFGS